MMMTTADRSQNRSGNAKLVQSRILPFNSSGFILICRAFMACSYSPIYFKVLKEFRRPRGQDWKHLEVD